jgi:molybdopterin molybdotransferase
MISFPTALRLLMENVRLVGIERCRIEQASGRVLRSRVVADRDVPAYDRVMMDGYALRMADWQAGCREFRVHATAAAGSAVQTLAGEFGVCVEVMTGAACPLGADLIFPVEEVVARKDGICEFAAATEAVTGRYIHRAGNDAVAGEILLEPACRLGSREIGVAASCGAAWLEVSRNLDIAVVATGDELVAVDEIPAAHQIRQSNAHSLVSALTAAGYAPRHSEVLGDDTELSRPAMERLLGAHEWLILTGAVSMGARDFVPSLLADLGCKPLFHGIAQRPGKPAGVWLGPAGQGVVALPGNPVSALTGLHALVLPALAVAQGLSPRPARQVILEDRGAQLPGMTRHLPVRLRADGRAEAAATGNSGDFIGLLKSDGFLTLPPRADGAPVSAAFPFTPWH